jgi:ABC-type uncharacterized transport system, permease component
MDELYIYLKLVRLQAKAQISDRGSFILKFISKIFSWGSGFVMIWIMLYKFQNLAGWSPYEVLFLYSLDIFSYSIIATFLINPCEKLPRTILTGEFDGIITRPVNSFFYYVFRSFSTGYFANFAMCLTVMIISIRMLDLKLNIFNLLFLILVLLGGALIQGALFILGTVPTFWMKKNDSLMGLLVFNIRSFIQYPLSIYNSTVQVFLTLIIPYGFINFFPAQYFLNKNDFLMFNPVFQYLTPVVGIVFFSIAYCTWHIGVNHYEGSGS